MAGVIPGVRTNTLRHSRHTKERTQNQGPIRVQRGVTFSYVVAVMRREHKTEILPILDFFRIFARVFVQKTWVQSGSNNSSQVLLSGLNRVVAVVCFQSVTIC
jgi:hypothetical protein